MAFNITAAVLLSGPENIDNIRNTIISKLNIPTVAINVQLSPQAQQQLNAVQTSMEKSAKSTAKATQATKQYAAATNVVVSSVRSQNAAISHASVVMEDFGYKSKLAVKRFLAFTLVATPILGAVGAITGAVREAIKYERELVKVAQVSNRQLSSMASLNKEISRLSTTFGIASSELVGVSKTLSQAGFSFTETKIALEALSKVALTPTFESMTDATEAAIAVMSQFKVEARDLEGVFGALDAVAGKYAVELPDLVSAIRRAGGAFHIAGGGLNELLALFTAVRSTTRESADTIATGFRTIFTRLQRANTVELLRSVGIELRDVNGEFVGAYESIRRINEGLKGVSTRSGIYAKIVEELGGFRQVSKVIPLIVQFDRAQEALGIAQRGQTEGLKNYQEVLKTLSVQLNITGQKFLQLIRDMVTSTAFKTMAEQVLRLANAFITFADAVRPMLPLLAAIGAVKLFVGAKTFVGGFAKAHAPKMAKGGTVPTMLTAGELYIPKKEVGKVGLSALDKLNRLSSTGISVVKGPPGIDKVGPVPLEAGSFIINKRSSDMITGGKFARAQHGGILGRLLGFFKQSSPLISKGYSTTIKPPPLPRGGYSGVTPPLLPSVASVLQSSAKGYSQTIPPPPIQLPSSGYSTTLRPAPPPGVPLRPATPQIKASAVRGVLGRMMEEERQRTVVIEALKQEGATKRKINAAMQRYDGALKKATDVTTTQGRRLQLDKSGQFAYARERAFRSFDAGVQTRGSLSSFGRTVSGFGSRMTGLSSRGIRSVASRLATPAAFGGAMLLQGSGLLEQGKDESRLSAGIKGGISGGLTAGLTTSLVAGGPAGLAVGLLAGVDGVLSALNDLEKGVQDAKLDKVLKQMSSDLEKFSKGLLTSEDLAKSLQRARTAVGKRSEAFAESEKLGIANKGLLPSISFGLAQGFSKLTFRGEKSQEKFNTEQLTKQFQFEIDANEKALGIAQSRFDQVIESGGSFEEAQKAAGGAGFLISLAKAEMGAAAFAEDTAKGGKELMKFMRDYRKTTEAITDVRRTLLEYRQAHDPLKIMLAETVSAFSAASNSVESFRSGLDVTKSIISGGIGFTNVSAAQTAIENRKFDATNFEGAIRTLGPRFGIGEDTQRAAIEAGVIERSLPSVLEKIIAQLKVSPAATSADFNVLLRKGLSGRGVSSKSIEGVTASINEELSQRNKGGIAEITKLRSSELLDLAESVNINKDIIDNFGELAKKENEIRQEYINNLAEAAKISQELIQYQNQAIGTRQRITERVADVRFQRGGTGSASILAETMSNFLSQQQNITGIAGPQAGSAEFLGGAFQQVSQQLEAAIEQQRLAEKYGAGPGIQSFEQASASVIQLQSSADKLRNGLLNLASSTDVVSAAQKRLSELQQQEESRFGLFERFATADSTGRREIAKEIEAAVKLQEKVLGGGNLEGMSAQERQRAFAGLSALGPSGERVKRQLFESSGFLPKGVRAEQDALIGLQNVFDENAATASDQLANALTTQHDIFLNKLAAMQNELYTNLGVFVQSIGGGKVTFPQITTQPTTLAPSIERQKYDYTMGIAGGGISQPTITTVGALRAAELAPKSRIVHGDDMISRREAAASMRTATLDERNARLGRVSIADRNANRVLPMDQRRLNVQDRARLMRGLPAINRTATTEESIVGALEKSDKLSKQTLTNTGMSTFATAATPLTTAIDRFSNVAQNMPTEIQLNIGEHNIVLSGQEQLANMVAKKLLELLKKETEDTIKDPSISPIVRGGRR